MIVAKQRRRERGKIPRAFQRNLEFRARPLGKQLQRFFEQLARREARRLREAGLLKVEAPPEKERIAASPVFKIDERDTERLTRILERQGRAQVKEAGEKTAGAIEDLPKFALGAAAAAALLRTKKERAQRILEVTRDRFERQAARLREEAAREERPPTERQLERRIREQATTEGPMSPGRAEGVARTETTQAINFGIFAAVAAAGIAVMARTEMEWVAVIDDVTRTTHADLDGQTRPTGEPFESASGALLRFPGDPAAPIEEIANCRCMLVPVM